MKETKNFKWFELGCRIVVLVGAIAVEVDTFWHRIQPLSPYDAFSYIKIIGLLILFIATLTVGLSGLGKLKSV